MKLSTLSLLSLVVLGASCKVPLPSTAQSSEPSDKAMPIEENAAPAIEESELDATTLSLAAEKVVLSKVSPRDKRTYQLTDRGNLYRIIGKNKCQITDKVIHFKVSSHAKDYAYIYFLRRFSATDRFPIIQDIYQQDLWMLGKDNENDSGSCPKANKLILKPHLKKQDAPGSEAALLAKGEKLGRYTVTPNASENVDSHVVNMALGKDNSLAGWDDARPTVNERGVSEYLMNTCYGSPGLSFKTYVAFGLLTNGQVLKVHGSRPGSDSKTTPERYASLQDFKAKNKVCSKFVPPPKKEFECVVAAKGRIFGTILFETYGFGNTSALACQIGMSECNARLTPIDALFYKCKVQYFFERQ